VSAEIAPRPTVRAVEMQIAGTQFGQRCAKVLKCCNQVVGTSDEGLPHNHIRIALLRHQRG
jgi:hypothetical protein